MFEEVDEIDEGTGEVEGVFDGEEGAAGSLACAVEPLGPFAGGEGVVGEDVFLDAFMPFEAPVFVGVAVGEKCGDEGFDLDPPEFEIGVLPVGGGLAVDVEGEFEAAEGVIPGDF